MFRIRKTFDVAVGHKLNLPYDSPCNRGHGHNFFITVYCAASELDENEMVVVFAHIKREIHGKIDHHDLYELFQSWFSENGEVVNPTSEKVAEWICGIVPKCYRVDVQESDGNVGIYEDDSFFLQ